MEPVDLEISLDCRTCESGANEYRVSLRGRLPGSAADVRSGDGIAHFDPAALQKVEANPTRYGMLLADALFADPQVSEAYAAARASAGSLGTALRLRLRIGPDAARLHALRWETLLDPSDGSPMAANANQPFSRYLGSADWRTVALRRKGRLGALLAASNPSDLAEYGLAAVDAAGELDRAATALSGMAITRLGGGERRAGLDDLLACLQQTEPDVLYLSCHGAWVQDDTWLWLEAADGTSLRVSGRELVERLGGLARRPVLVVLASCESADGRAQGSLSALAPRLVDAGIPAVLAMQARVSLETLSELMPAFFEGLQRHGRIDQALAEGRARVLDRKDYWVPAIFTRLEDGCIWDESPAAGTPAESGPLLPGDDALPEPGALPAGYRLELSRNENFTGRAADLLAAWKALKPGPGKPAAFLALAGIGGVGKSQLAVEFCHRYGAYYAGVHWLAAGTSLEGEIAACGFAMGIKPWPETQAEQVRDTLLAWQGGGRRLVVIDGLEDEALASDWLPRLGNASVLLTTRRLEWPEGSGLTVQRLGLPGRPESLALLRRLAPALEKLDDAALDPLAERLGDLPLALDLAGRFFRDNPDLTPVEYLDELAAGEGGLEHTSLSDWVKSNPTRHATSLAATFLLSWQKLAGDGDEMARLLFMGCGICASNTPIPLAALEASQGAVEKSERREVGRALRRLYGLGLLEPGERGPVIHTLLAEYARTLDEQNDFHGLLSMASGLGQAANAANVSELPVNFTPLLAHMENAIPWAEAAMAEDTAYLLNELGSYYRVMAEYEKAHRCYARSLEINEDIYGPDDLEIAVAVNNLASSLQDLDRLDEARVLFERAIAIDEMSLGPRHPDVARDVNNLGNLLNALKDLDGAEAAFRRALSIDEQAAPDSPAVAIDLSNLANVLQSKGDLEQAEPMHRRALEIDRRIYGPEHPHVARDLNNLGGLILERGDVTGALEAFRQAMAIDEAAFGPRHPNVAMALNNLGDLYAGLGELETSIGYLARARDILVEFLPEGHSQRATVERNLAKVQAALDEAGLFPA